MSDETYYTVLNVKEAASASEIKTAYRDIIKKVHPDTIATSAPYLRRIAEDKTKEIIEAYKVLSDFGKRRDYDTQLAAYRHENAEQAPPQPTPPPPTQAGDVSKFLWPFLQEVWHIVLSQWIVLTLGIPFFLVWLSARVTPAMNGILFALALVLTAAIFLIAFLIERRNSRARIP